MIEELREVARRTNDERAIRSAIPRGEDAIETLASELWCDCTLADRTLLRALIAHEIEVRRVVDGCGDGLYALCFLLHTLGQIEDVLLIYEAKFTNMDCGVMLDHDLLTMRRDRAEMLAFVAHRGDERLERAVIEAFDAPNYPTYEALAASYRAYFAVWSKP